MKIMTILGTRPEIIRLSLVIKELDKFCEHRLVHTGQNYEESLSDIFFRELGVRLPDYSMGIRAESFGGQVAALLSETEKLMKSDRPDKLLILGDTNSGLSAIVAKRLGIPVYHMESGNRCYDDRVPEEVNRRIIDHSSDILMPYTERSKENLIKEGIERQRIFVTGNPIYEVLEHYKNEIRRSNILASLDLEEKKYLLVTMHRAENVDIEMRLRNLVATLQLVSEKYSFPVVCSLHPRTKSKVEKFGISLDQDNVKYLNPLGFFDFVALERRAFCVLSDSGTVQEECSIYGVPNVTMRDVTERPETVECGSNIITGDNPLRIMESVAVATNMRTDWRPPDAYIEPLVSQKVLKILFSKNPEIPMVQRGV